MPSEPLDDQVHVFFSQPRNECVAENANDGPPRLSRSQGKGNRLTISRMIDDLPPASFEKCGDEHHSNRKEQTLLSAPGMTARGQFGPCATRLSPGAAKVPWVLARSGPTGQPNIIQMDSNGDGNATVGWGWTLNQDPIPQTPL